MHEIFIIVALVILLMLFCLMTLHPRFAIQPLWKSLLDFVKTSRRLLFRVLRDDEVDVKRHGITAKDPKAEKTIISHVICGSRKNYASQFISCSTDFQAAIDFAKKNISSASEGVKKIAVIDWDALVKHDITVHDLNNAGHDILTSPRARNYAHRYKEALVERNIPPDCITGVTQVSIKVKNKEIQHEVHDITPDNSTTSDIFFILTRLLGSFG